MCNIHARAVNLLEKAGFVPSETADYALNDDTSWEVVKLVQNTLKRSCLLGKNTNRQ